MILAEIDFSSYRLYILGPLCLWQCLVFIVSSPPTVFITVWEKIFCTFLLLAASCACRQWYSSSRTLTAFILYFCICIFYCICICTFLLWVAGSFSIDTAAAAFYKKPPTLFAALCYSSSANTKTIRACHTFFSTSSLFKCSFVFASYSCTL